MLRKRWKESLRSSYKICEVSTLLNLIQFTSRLRPAILLLDVTTDVFQAAKQIPLLLEESPGTRIIALTAKQTEKEAVLFLKEGVKGYANVNLDMVLLRKAINMVQKGEVWIDRRFIPCIIEDAIQSNVTRIDLQNIPLHRLSDRERQIALGIAHGASNKEVAAQLQISETTVKSHLTRVFSKLGVTDRLTLALLVMKEEVRIKH